MTTLLSTLADAFHRWRQTRIAASHAAAYVLLFSALFFLLGSDRPHAEYRALEEKLSAARADVRVFASEIARRNTALNTLRTREDLANKTIALLNRRIDALEAQRIHWQEQTAFYRHVLADDSSSGEIIIHALDVNPDFSRQQWELSAVLARPGSKRKAFEGAYYFEIVQQDAKGAHTLTQQPAEAHPFSMDLYHEIREQVVLPPQADISNLRLIVLDKKGKLIASDAMLSEDGDSGGDDSDSGGDDGNSEGGNSSADAAHASAVSGS